MGRTETNDKALHMIVSQLHLPAILAILSNGYRGLFP
jgi:hypothetical protein